jgi:hypothetical protein
MRKRAFGLRIAGMLLAIMLLYPLSLGPVAVLFTRMHLREDGPAGRATVTLYSPLRHLAEISPGFGRAAGAYCMWWMSVTGTSPVIPID